MTIKCSKCLDKEFPCADCRNKRLADLTKQLPLQGQILVHIIKVWMWLGWIPYKLRIVKLRYYK